MSDLSTPGHAAVRVVKAADPAAEAGRLAQEVGGDIAADVAAAEQAVRARVDAGRRAVAGDDTLLARADEIRAAAAQPPPISDDEVEELRHTAADLGRAARIRDRTEARAADVLQARVAASSGVALHPTALIDASSAVLEAETALRTAERALLGHGSAPPTDAVPDDPPVADDDPVLGRAFDDFDEASLVRLRTTRIGNGLGAALAGAGILAVALGAPVLVLVVAVVAGVGVAIGFTAKGRASATRITERDEVDLQAVARAVESTESGRMVASLDAADRWAGERARLEAARDEAEELLRVARNRWHQLAGPTADPRDAQSIVRAHDPQLAYDAAIAGSSPTVRTVAAFHRRVQARWRVLWAARGHDEPPAPEDLESILDGLLAEHRAAQDELRRLEAAEAAVAAQEVLRRPLLLVEPRVWVAPGRLAQLLASVPPDGEVVLVERDPDANR